MGEEQNDRPPGAMQQDEIDEIAHLLNERISHSGRCEVCREGRYSIAPHLVAPPSVRPVG